MIFKPQKYLLKIKTILIIIVALFLTISLPEIVKGQININTNPNPEQSIVNSFRSVETRRIGNIVYAPIILDGREVFTIASPASATDKDILSIDFRVNQIENQLKALINRGDPKTT